MSKTYTVTIINDNIVECNEVFILTLSLPTSPCEVVSGSDDNTEVIIRDNDGKRYIASYIVLLLCAMINSGSVVI